MKPTQREGKSAAMGSCPGVAWVGVDGLAPEGHGELSEVEETLYLDCGGACTCLRLHQNSHTVYLNWVHFVLWKLHLDKVDFKRKKWRNFF